MEFLKQSDEVLSVGEFSRRFKLLVKTQVPELWLRGEISNLKTYSSGHTYFTLKDEDGAISAVLFKGFSRALSFALKEGMRILAYGEVTIYEARGNYQLVIKAMMPDGAGDLAKRFEELKQKLSQEGLFDASRKKEIPKLPKRIAVVTSPTGAAVRDFCRILIRRGWRGEVYVLPSRVQGAEAAKEIVEMIKYAQTYTFSDGGNFDLLVAMRGGGSLEDLWPFNEEIVARAISECKIPTISAVGHEIDFTLCDFASDLRAETPSAAAEYISSAFVEAKSELDYYGQSIEKHIDFLISNMHQSLMNASNILRLNSPQSRIENARIGLDETSVRLESAISEQIFSFRKDLAEATLKYWQSNPMSQISVLKEQLRSFERQLSIMSVESTLNRGFAIISNSDGKHIASVSQIASGEVLTTRLSDGKFDSTVNTRH